MSPPRLLLLLLACFACWSVAGNLGWLTSRVLSFAIPPPACSFNALYGTSSWENPASAPEAKAGMPHAKPTRQEQRLFSVSMEQVEESGHEAASMQQQHEANKTAALKQQLKGYGSSKSLSKSMGQNRGGTKGKLSRSSGSKGKMKGSSRKKQGSSRS